MSLSSVYISITLLLCQGQFTLNLSLRVTVKISSDKTKQVMQLPTISPLEAKVEQLYIQLQLHNVFKGAVKTWDRKQSVSKMILC